MQWRALPFHSDCNFSGSRVEGVEPALHEKSPLQTEGGDQEVEAHTTEAVAFQKGHEESESNKDHDVDVLEAFKEETAERKKSVMQQLHFITYGLHANYNFKKMIYLNDNRL